MRPRVSRAICLAAVVIAPLLIFSKGYLPVDDAFRHVGKVLSGRPWSEILLLRPEITLDSNPGWHWLLGLVHRWGGLGPADLLVFSVVSLFALYSLGPILLLRHPEAWLIAIVLMGVVESSVPERWLTGRPYLLSSAIVPVFCLLWPRLERPRPWPTLGLFAACGALSCWIHGSYFLLALPVAALLVVGRWRAGSLLAAAFATGIVVGALLTGHPLGHLWQMLLHAYLAIGIPHASRALASEFQPVAAPAVAVAGFLALVAWRSKRLPDGPQPWRDPVVAMIAGCWALGYVAARFWLDWAIPALLALIACEIDAALDGRLRSHRTRMALATVGSACLLLLTTAADIRFRWTTEHLTPLLPHKDPAIRPWLPDPGGIVYSADMLLFYGMFYSNPTAPWKYVLGFEPAIMRREDYAVFVEIKRTLGATEAYLPWLRRMRWADRLYVRQESNTPPAIPGLEWYQPAYSIWAGRLPRTPPAGPSRPPGPVAPPPYLAAPAPR